MESCNQEIHYNGNRLNLDDQCSVQIVRFLLKYLKVNQSLCSADHSRAFLMTHGS